MNAVTKDFQLIILLFFWTQVLSPSKLSKFQLILWNLASFLILLILSLYLALYFIFLLVFTSSQSLFFSFSHRPYFFKWHVPKCNNEISRFLTLWPYWVDIILEVTVWFRVQSNNDCTINAFVRLVIRLWLFRGQESVIGLSGLLSLSISLFFLNYPATFFHFYVKNVRLYIINLYYMCYRFKFINYFFLQLPNFHPVWNLVSELPLCFVIVSYFTLLILFNFYVVILTKAHALCLILLLSYTYIFASACIFPRK